MLYDEYLAFLGTLALLPSIPVEEELHSEFINFIIPVELKLMLNEL